MYNGREDTAHHTLESLVQLCPLFLGGADFGSFGRKVLTEISLNSRVLFWAFPSVDIALHVQQKLILFLHVIMVFQITHSP
jgi:hypothetical protein